MKHIISHKKYNGHRVFRYPNLNPLNLPPYTIRLKFLDDFDPSAFSNVGDWMQVSSSPNIWDLTILHGYWGGAIGSYPEVRVHLIEVLGGNTSDVNTMTGLFHDAVNLTEIALFDTRKVIDMRGMFQNCTSLTTVPLFETSNVPTMTEMFIGCTALIAVPIFDTTNLQNAKGMFQNCTSLISVPLLNTNKLVNMDKMFYGCSNVESGALALYQQASTQANPPTSHQLTFWACGGNTQTGYEEWLQIPRDWK